MQPRVLSTGTRTKPQVARPFTLRGVYFDDGFDARPHDHAPLHWGLEPWQREQAWPHSVMDDDAYRPRAWGIVHSEVRYIRDLLRKLQGIGIDRVIGNLYLPCLQLSNTYAYGRLLQDPETEASMVITDFARIVAHPADAEALAEVLTWVDNHSSWELQHPADARLPHLPCTLTDQTTALRQAKQVRPNSSPPLPLPIKPRLWLDDLLRSIGRMTWTGDAPEARASSSADPSAVNTPSAG